MLFSSSPFLVKRMNEKYYVVEVTETFQRSFVVPMENVRTPEEAVKLVSGAVHCGIVELDCGDFVAREVSLNTSVSESSVVEEDVAKLFKKISGDINEEVYVTC